MSTLPGSTCVFSGLSQYFYICAIISGDSVREINFIFYLFYHFVITAVESGCVKKTTQFGIARARPTGRGCRDEVRKKRAISTVVTDLRQSSSQVRNNYILMHDSGGNLEEMANLHSPFDKPFNIRIVPSRSVSKNCIVVERTPLLPAQKKRSPLLTLCLANVQAIKSKTSDLPEYICSTDMDIFPPPKPGSKKKMSLQNWSLYQLRHISLYNKIGKRRKKV